MIALWVKCGFTLDENHLKTYSIRFSTQLTEAPSMVMGLGAVHVIYFQMLKGKYDSYPPTSSLAIRNLIILIKSTLDVI